MSAGTAVIIPNFIHSSPEKEKVIGYLLNEANPESRAKAAFFLNLGFRADRWDWLSDALLLAAIPHWGERAVTAHGQKFTLVGRLGTPCGEQMWIRTVWIVEGENVAPRLITAYPAKEYTYMFRENERVVLTTPVPAERLQAGDIGVVVHAYRDRKAYEVEFFMLRGETLAVVTLEAGQLRHVGIHEIAHARTLAPA